MIYTDPNGVYRLDLGISVREGSAPPTPANTFGYFYAKTDGKPYFKNDAGTEYDLTSSGGAGVYQPLDADLTTLAGLTATTDNFIVSVSGAWASRTPAQVKSTLSLNNVDNTSDANKPISTATQTALNTKGYTLILTGSQGTFVDGQTYYSGAITTGTGTTAAINRVYIPVSGTITDIVVYQLTAGTLSSGESSSLFIRYDNTTDVTISTSVLNTSASEVYSAHGLSQAVTADHYIELKFLSATWATTNPTNVRWTCTVFIKS